jgi:hypothetical protein
MYVQAQEIAEQSVPAVAQADGLQPGKQSPLLFIEQAIEQQGSGLEFIKAKKPRIPVKSRANYGLHGYPELLTGQQ